MARKRGEEDAPQPLEMGMRRVPLEGKSESVDKPGSVVDDHSSATGVTTCL
tara:strand:+ start:359 stop:511 length:153 start_codon:yes stop_codon:yes gene_type:complete